MNRKWTRPGSGWLIASLTVALATVGHAATKPSGDFLHRIDTSLETPHTKWAKPYAGGTVRALIFAPYAGPAREVVELWQRLDLDFVNVATWHPQQLQFGATDYYSLKLEGTSEAEKLREALDKLQGDYDVILMASPWPSRVPPEVRFRLWEKVRAGTGLVWVFHSFADLGAPITPDDNAQQAG